MIAKNRAQLKSWIKNMSAKVDVNENIILQNYMLERLLERISVSNYKYKFVLKGGMLITAIVGIDMRNTLDMDATIKGFNLEKDNLENILNEIFSIDLDDGVTFEFRNTKEIRQEDEYGGYRVSLDAKFDKLVVPMKLDITTGDVIVPKEVNYKFGLMFENRSIEILAYNMETIIADKFETIISRNIDTTRARDFYDIYILWTTQQKNFNKELLGQAIVKKFEYRGSMDKLNNIDEIMEVIEESEVLKEHWKNYQSKFSYAEDIGYEDTMRVLEEIIKLLKIERKCYN
ncbi:nucleotidyl transferase AbiEii/AbiGii toxin family protein [Romboutsia ilealis]|uniref:nucleotidyl transferase AbiEii/AbiGii toxin family protein n=1 Tax=Romboutsia ilealis TaxID=1115758 RepID=UPI002573D8AA|nr:nucleotidyl transferase AbiEii/AbiGii toxin family protein [Romboutsia ilealis]